MSWAEFYQHFFANLQTPAVWIDAGVGAGGAVDNARPFSLPNGGGYVWVGFSGNGNSNARALKVERFDLDFANFGGPDARQAKAIAMRAALVAANVPFQSGHENRKQADSAEHFPEDQCFWRTTPQGGVVLDKHPTHRGAAVVNRQIGIERAGNAGRIVAWRPAPLVRANRNVPPPQQDVAAAKHWLEAAMAAMAALP